VSKKINIIKSQELFVFSPVIFMNIVNSVNSVILS